MLDIVAQCVRDRALNGIGPCVRILNDDIVLIIYNINIVSGASDQGVSSGAAVQ
jgi:hypothetical protein